MLFAPLFYGFLILSEHTLSGAGRVYHNTIKNRKHRRQTGRLSFTTTPFETPIRSIFWGKDLCPGRMDFIGKKEAFPFNRDAI